MPPAPLPYDRWPVYREERGVERATAELLELGLGDGLPVVPPTQGRLDRMLDGVTDPSAGEAIPPMRQRVSAAAVGYQSVLAGCEPQWLDVVLAAVRACAEPPFNALGVLTTTGTACAAVILDPLAAAAVGANAGANGLGPGNRANASIGRAVQLSLAALGGAVPGVVDMATMGQPGKYTFCCAEAAGSPLLAPLHERRGVAAPHGAVTVVGAVGTSEVVAGWTADPQALVELLAGSLPMLGALSPTSRRFGGGEQFLLVPPELAATFARAGWTLARIQEAILTLGAVPSARLPPAFREQTVGDDVSVAVADAAQDIHLVLTGGVGAKVTHVPTWSGSRSVTRAVVPLRTTTGSSERSVW
jgi:hypothetical protein